MTPTKTTAMLRRFCELLGIDYQQPKPIYGSANDADLEVRCPRTRFRVAVEWPKNLKGLWVLHVNNTYGPDARGFNHRLTGDEGGIEAIAPFLVHTGKTLSDLQRGCHDCAN